MLADLDTILIRAKYKDVSFNTIKKKTATYFVKGGNNLPSTLSAMNENIYKIKFGPTGYKNRSSKSPQTFCMMLSLKQNIQNDLFTQAVDVATTLYNVSMGVAVQDPTAGPPVSNVEKCVCPPEYTVNIFSSWVLSHMLMHAPLQPRQKACSQVIIHRLIFQGDFCDKCAEGYTRATQNGGPFSECVPCQCNNHNEVPCDPETGVCTCIHNTQGDHCDTCKPNYYGYPPGGTPCKWKIFAK